MKYAITLIAMLGCSAAWADVSADSDANSQSSSGSFSSVHIGGSDGPHRFTGHFGAIIGSSANDRCGRVAVGVPYSAHTCNIIMEAEALYSATLTFGGPKVAAKAALSHLCANDRTMRKTLVRQGLCVVK